MKRIIHAFILVVVLFSQSSAEELANLAKLAKLHYWRPVIQNNQEYTPEWREKISQLARITGTVNVSLPWQDRESTMVLRDIAEETGAKVCFFSNFWHGKAGRGNPNWHPGDEVERKKETDFYAERIQNMVDWLGTTEIYAVQVDCEMWYYKPWTTIENRNYNLAIEQNYATTNRMLKEGFGEQVKIIWYSYGGVQKGATNSGFLSNARFRLGYDHSDMFACQLYYGPEIRHQRDVVTQTALRGAEYGKQTMAYLSLGNGLVRGFDNARSHGEWDYELIYSWQMGREVNNPWHGQQVRERRYAPWRLVPEIYLWGGPHLLASEVSEKHFVAYCLGAAGDKRVE